jgi:hypothetical protein
MDHSFDNKKIIGRADIIDFPNLKVYDIKAKIDTGAYTSSIHCSNIQLFEEDGKKFISFSIPARKKGQFLVEDYKTSRFKQKKIKSSIGHAQLRYVIKTRVIIFNEVLSIEFSLSDRSKMKYPILLGRKLLANRFIVDVTQINLSQKSKLENS